MVKKRGQTELKKRFASLLLQWNQTQNKRQMPWKGEKNPYRIWLSEIILQQTRVEQGLDYYNKFIKAFPDIHHLANAREAAVYKLWEGLGYYTRCRNLIATARSISQENNGLFPDTYEGIKALRGVGPYTASAIASFAFDLPHAVVDGNVFRVLSRIFGIYTPVDSTQGKKIFTRLANELLDKQRPGIYNQAIMDFGAVICKPAPLCSQCVFQQDCMAFLRDKISELPVKEKRNRIRKRWFYYLVMNYQKQVVIQQRLTKDIWQNLYEFPFVETPSEEDLTGILKAAEKKNILSKGNFQVIKISGPFKQQLTHQLVNARFISIKINQKQKIEGSAWIRATHIDEFPFPRLINQYLQLMPEEHFFHKL